MYLFVNREAGDDCIIDFKRKIGDIYQKFRTYIQIASNCIKEILFDFAIPLESEVRFLNYKRYGNARNEENN